MTIHGGYALKFDELLTSSSRLSIVAALFSGKTLSFTKLKQISGLADGNLHVQTRKLADAGYVEIIKKKKGRRSVTEFRISELGIESLKLHVRKLQRIVATETGQIGPTPASEKRDESQVWH